MKSGPDTPLYSPDGQFIWNGSEWVTIPESDTENPETTQEYNQELDVSVATEESSITPKQIRIGIFSLIIIFGISLSSGGDEFEFEFYDSQGFLYITEFEADNGEPNRMIEITVFYDEKNRGTINTGEDCTALIYYDMPRTYYVEELCLIYIVDPYNEYGTFTFCAEYVSSGQDYDLHGEADSSGGSCVWWSDVLLLPPYILNPDDEPTVDECSEDGELIEGELTLGRTLDPSGLDDGDSNAYNGRLEVMLTYILTYQCKLM